MCDALKHRLESVFQSGIQRAAAPCSCVRPGTRAFLVLPKRV
ncbi:hypothetical protein HMPREF9554_00038 [Treponema phagedenis F0421]|nr:hypothetical protein HMPREF9554_00038 [Treponema phagedenis F0421]